MQSNASLETTRYMENSILDLLKGRGHPPIRVTRPEQMTEREFLDWVQDNHYEMFITFAPEPFASPQPSKEWWIKHLNTCTRSLYGTYAPLWFGDIAPAEDTEDAYIFFSRLAFELSAMETVNVNATSGVVLQHVRDLFDLATKGLPEGFLLSLYTRELSAREVAEAIYFLQNRNLPVNQGPRWYTNQAELTMVLQSLPHQVIQ